MATPFLARFSTKKNEGCTNTSLDFPPRKYNILLPDGPKSVQAGVTTKISWMDSLPNYLSYGAPLERAKNSATIPSIFEGLDHVASLFYEYSTTNKKELEVQTHHTQ